MKLIVNSPDYNAFEADGVTPRITRLEAVVVGSVPNPIAGLEPGVRIDLGKPTADADGIVRIPVEELPFYNGLGEFGGALTFTVDEVGPGGTSVSSDPVTVSRNEAPGRPAVVVQ